jgi:DNA polymerase-3 subunit epsilon
MNFVALDVETANSDYSSICQIGIVTFENGVVKETWHSLINPEEPFDPANIGVHGITPSAVKNSPKFTDVFDCIRSLLSNQVVAHHTAFDKISVTRASAKYGLHTIDCRWLDTAKVVRRTWPQFSKSGYGLRNVATAFNIKFDHHIAHEDARAAGEILIRAIQETGSHVGDWISSLERLIDSRKIRS